jgi:hypothetical protein
MDYGLLMMGLLYCLSLNRCIVMSTAGDIALFGEIR